MLIQAWISDYIHHNVWYDINNPYTNPNAPLRLFNYGVLDWGTNKSLHPIVFCEM